MADATSYRNVTGTERDTILTAIPPLDIPPEGKIVSFQGRKYLYFRDIWSYTYVVDVTDNVPAQLETIYPAPAGFLDEVKARIGTMGGELEDALKILIPIVAIIAGLMLWQNLKK